METKRRRAAGARVDPTRESEAKKFVRLSDMVTLRGIWNPRSPLVGCWCASIQKSLSSGTPGIVDVDSTLRMSISQEGATMLVGGGLVSVKASTRF